MMIRFFNKETGKTTGYASERYTAIDGELYEVLFRNPIEFEEGQGWEVVPPCIEFYDKTTGLAVEKQALFCVDATGQVCYLYGGEPAGGIGWRTYYSEQHFEQERQFYKIYQKRTVG